MKIRIGMIALIALGACAGEVDPPGKSGDAGFRDAGTNDAGEIRDAGPPSDAGPPPSDGGEERDAGTTPDAGMDRDAGPRDIGPVRRGSCEDPTDCAGSPCLRIPDEPNGYRVCANVPVPEQTMCIGAADQCCFSAQCTAQPGGRCYFGPRFYCGGVAPQPANECFYDECTVRADCTAEPHGVCLPREAYAEVHNRCVYGGCVFRSDCTEGPDPACSPYFDPCNNRFIGFHCSYTTSECRADKDCADMLNGYCFPGTNGVTECRTFVPPP